MNDFSPTNYPAEAKLAKELGIKPWHVCVVGSTLICGKGKDTDFLCLVPSEDAVTKAGFEPDIEVQYESELRSFRRADQNVIATTSANFFFAEMAIAHAAKLVRDETFNMDERDERVRFHSTVRAQVLARMIDTLEF